MAEPEPKHETPPSSEYEPNSSQEPNPQVPGGESSPEKSTLPFPNAEPQVDLTTVSELWEISFKLHWIFFAFCFAILFIYNAYQLYKTHRLKNMTNRSYATIVQILVIALGLTRTLALSLSPYELVSNTPKRVPYVITRLLFSFGYPCLFSGFVFVHKIFLLVSKVRVMTRNALGNELVAIVLVVHYVAVISSEFAASYIKGADFLLVICALYYMVGCLGISVSLLFSGRRVVHQTQRIAANLSKFQNTSTNVASENNHRKRVDGTAKVIRVTLLAAIFGVLCALFYIYTMVVMIRAISDEYFTPKPWNWLTVNTFLRIFELCLAATMSYAVHSSYQRNTSTRILADQASTTLRT